MLLTIITALVCFVAAVVMFTPYYRKMALLRPMALYLIFEGVMIMLTYIISDLYPTSTTVDIINRVGTLIIVVYYIFILVMTKIKSKRKYKNTEEYWWKIFPAIYIQPCGLLSPYTFFTRHSDRVNLCFFYQPFSCICQYGIW